MKNKFATITFCAAAICGALAFQSMPAVADDTTTVVTQNNVNPARGVHIHVIIDGSPVDFNGPGPIMMGGGYVFVPIRGVFEQMGGDVQWHEDSQVIEGVKPGHMFRIRVGSTDALVNGQNTTLPAPPQLIGGTTYVPLRFASESLGAHVRWDPDRNTVFIRSHGDDETDSDTGDGMRHPMHDHSGVDANGETTTTTTIIKKTTT